MQSIDTHYNHTFTVNTVFEDTVNAVSEVLHFGINKHKKLTSSGYLLVIL